MKHLMNLAKAFAAAGIVLEVGGRIAPKLPEAAKIKTYDLRPVLAGGGALFGLITVVSMVGGKKIAGKLTPAV
jgi:hypothetical protein